MIKTDLSTLKIHRLTQAQYERELAAGRLDENALYLTPDEAAATKVNKISDTSTSITVTVADNTEYRYPNATTVNITCPSGEYECWLKLGAAARTVSIANAVCMTSCSLTPADLTSGGGHIEISIKDGIYIIQKVE